MSLPRRFDAAFRRATSFARRLIDRMLPASMNEQATNLGRRSKQKWHERKRHGFVDDGAYFDHVVADAIEQSRQAAHDGRR